MNIDGCLRSTFDQDEVIACESQPRPEIGASHRSGQAPGQRALGADHPARARLGSGPGQGPVEEKEVHEPIVVVVQGGHGASQRFKGVLHLRGEVDLPEIDLRGGILKNLIAGREFRFIPLPDFAFKIAEAGGLLQSIKRRPFFHWSTVSWTSLPISSPG
jgi:hypothetical protein